MAGESEKIRQSIRDLVLKDERVYLLICEVVSVSGSECVVKSLESGIEIQHVRLMANENDQGFLITPKVGSSVIVDWLDSKHPIVTMFSEVDEIHLRGVDNGGIPITSDLVERLNTVEGDLNDLKQAFSTWVPVLNDGGGALKTATSQWSSSTIIETTEEDIQSTTVKHG